MEKTLGEKLHPILLELESTVDDYQKYNGPPKYPNECLRSALSILFDVVMDRMWALQEKEGIDLEARCKMAEECGEKLRDIIKTYTGEDPHLMYLNKN